LNPAYIYCFVISGLVIAFHTRAGSGLITIDFGQQVHSLISFFFNIIYSKSFKNKNFTLTFREKSFTIFFESVSYA
jgi:hypothetical protein